MDEVAGMLTHMGIVRVDGKLMIVVELENNKEEKQKTNNKSAMKRKIK